MQRKDVEFRGVIGHTPPKKVALAAVPSGGLCENPRWGQWLEQRYLTNYLGEGCDQLHSVRRRLRGDCWKDVKRGLDKYISLRYYPVC